MGSDMHFLYVFSVWVHILAATTWLGGMLFLVLVVVPWLRRGGRTDAAIFLRETGKRFRGVGWVCFLLLVITGTFNLWMRGVRITDLVRPEWQASPFGRTVLVKLGAFAAVIVVSAIHDFVVGPRAIQAIAKDPTSGDARLQRRRASQLGRVNVVLALVLVAAGVLLVRGVPG